METAGALIAFYGNPSAAYQGTDFRKFKKLGKAFVREMKEYMQLRIAETAVD